jgi:hypothetical protein
MSHGSMIGHSPPPSLTYSVSGTGASFINAPTLGDGCPARVTRIGWLSAVSPATTDYVALRVLFGTAQPIGLCVLLGIVLTDADGTRRVPTAQRISVLGRRALDPGYTYALGGNSVDARTEILRDGSAALWFVLGDPIDDLLGVEFRVYNDDAGATWADATSTWEAGLALPMTGTEVGIRPGYTTGVVDPTLYEITPGGKPLIAARIARRTLPVELVQVDQSGAYGAALRGRTDYDRIEQAMLRGRPVALVPYADIADHSLLQRTAIFGTARPRGLGHIPRRLWDQAVQIEERPPADPPT